MAAARGSTPWVKAAGDGRLDAQRAAVAVDAAPARRRILFGKAAWIRITTRLRDWMRYTSVYARLEVKTRHASSHDAPFKPGGLNAPLAHCHSPLELDCDEQDCFSRRLSSIVALRSAGVRMSNDGAFAIDFRPGRGGDASPRPPGPWVRGAEARLRQLVAAGEWT